MIEQQFINLWNENINQTQKKVAGFITLNINDANFYEKSKRQPFDIGFNVFTISSDLYYRENFHSDIIKAFLDPSEKHNEGLKYLFLFIDLINNSSNLNINKLEFENARVIREKHNIDILITDDKSKNAILIENKINNAKDQPRQLPKYYAKLSEEYQVKAIVYLTINSSKTPEKFDWTELEILDINPLLSIIPSFDKSQINLFKNWIIPAIIDSKNSESLFLLQQYGNLIKHLNSKTMDTVSVERFYNTLKESDNLKTGISIRNMLNDIPEYMAIRIEDKYKNRCHPFSKIWRYQLRDCVFECYNMKNYSVKMDIWCGEYGYKVHVWNPNDIGLNIKLQLPQLTCITDFVFDGPKVNNVFKEFSFYEEEKLYEFIDQIILELKSI